MVGVLVGNKNGRKVVDSLADLGGAKLKLTEAKSTIDEDLGET